MQTSDDGTARSTRPPLAPAGRRILLVVAALAASGLVWTALAAAGSGSSAAAAGFVASWAASSVQGSAVPGSTCPAGGGLTNSTVRNVVFIGAGGSAVRVRLTNAFGTQPLQVGHASVAVQASGATPAGAVSTLTFGGQRAATIAAGARVTSDPVTLSVAALSTLLVSVFVPGPTGPITFHPFTAQGNFLASGDLAAATSATGFSDTPCWMFIDAVDVQPANQVIGSVVALGDSITDTANTTGNANHRWPDDTARRLNALSGSRLSIVNAGLGGNRVLAARPEPFWGVAALDRLDRDVFTASGVRAVILLEGINDIGFSATSDQIIAGYRQIVSQSHAHGLPVFGGTMTPFRSSAIWSTARQQTWDAVNGFVRTGGVFDGVIDFAAATGSASDPLTLNPAFDSGDHLHPNDAGTQAMAGAIDLARLVSAAQGTPTPTPTPTGTPTATPTPTPTPTATPTPSPSSGGGVTVTPVVASSGPFFTEEDIRLSNASPLTALAVTIVIQRTAGVSFSGQYNTLGGAILQANSSTASAITYTYTLASGQTLPTGTGRLFGAQASGSGTAHPTGGDTFSVTFSTGGGTTTQTGHF
jgi:lysophospholipase L1-like esterase